MRQGRKAVGRSAGPDGAPAFSKALNVLKGEKQLAAEAIGGELSRFRKGVHGIAADAEQGCYVFSVEGSVVHNILL